MGERYRVFGTNPAMLERGDLEGFKHCDLARYPVGELTGFNNTVVLWVCKLLAEHQYNADIALSLYLKGQSLEVDPQTGKAGNIDTYWIIAKPEDI